MWTGPSDIAVVATRTGAGALRGRRPPTRPPAAGVSLVGIGAEDAPLRAACSGRPRAVRRRCRRPGCGTRRCGRCSPRCCCSPPTWSCCPAGVADPEAIAAALDEVAGECGPAQESFVNPAKTLALELLDALPVIAAEGPLAGAAATRIADQLATLAGLPATGFRLPDQRVAACAVLGGPLAPRDGRRLLPRPGRRRRPPAAAADHPRRRRRRARRRGGARAAVGRPRRWTQVLRTAAAHNVPVSGLAEHGDPAGSRRLPRLARQLAVADFTAVYLALALDNERALALMTPSRRVRSTAPAG